MHKAYKIKKVIKETPKAVSIILDGKIDYKPGQFVMLWLPGVDEKPFALSYQNKNEFGITIEIKGEFTKAISKVKPGTKVGIRGPYGNSFTIKDNAILIAGGLGMAPSLAIIKNIKNSTIIQGAKSKEFLLYLEDKELLKTIEKNNNKIIYCTDDGSFGIHGFTSDVLKDLIKQKPKIIYTVGPEIMMLAILNIANKNNIKCEASLERFMRCGIGLCGSCACDDQLVCKDGPVFNSDKLSKLKDLGKYAELKSGKKVTLKEYFSYRSK